MQIFAERSLGLVELDAHPLGLFVLGVGLAGFGIIAAIFVATMVKCPLFLYTILPNVN